MALPFWSNVFHYTFARGYIRIPMMLSVPILFNKYVLYQYEPLFLSWNKGHNQNDIWNRLQAKVAAEAQ